MVTMLATASPVPFLFSRAHWSFAPSMMRRLLKIELSWAFSRAFTKFGIAIAANNPMMATTIMISTSVKPAVLFVLICMSYLSILPVRGVNEAKGGLLLLLNWFTNCRLQPRLSTLANGMPQSTFAEAQLSGTNRGCCWSEKGQFSRERTHYTQKKRSLNALTPPVA